MVKRTDPDDWELRDEYDFSSGVRGKHATRFVGTSAQRTASWLRGAAEYDRQSWVSETLRQAQDLEGLLVAYLVLAFDTAPRDAGVAIAASLEQPLGALQEILDDLSEGPSPAPADLASRLRHTLHRRNWLVHKSMQTRLVDAGQAELESTRGSVLRLQALFEDLAALQAQLEELMKARLRQRGMTEAEFHGKCQEVLRQWVAA